MAGGFDFLLFGAAQLRNANALAAVFTQGHWLEVEPHTVSRRMSSDARHIHASLATVH